MASTIYSPLDHSTGEIRLLTIQPHNLSSPRLHCELRQVPLDKTLKFQALSYVWGDESAKHSIVINGENIDIRPNLYSALCHIQGQYTDLNLWCDALCINQKDDNERNRQVLRMRDIYGNAERVIIWLGEEQQKSDLAMKNIQDWDNFFPSLIEQPSLLLRPELTVGLFDPVAWEAMCCLFERAWWRRIWVLQEVAVSRSAVLVCGSAQCEWESFICAKAAWERLMEPALTQFLAQDQVKMLLSPRLDVGVAAIFLQGRQVSRGEVGLLSLIRLTGMFMATNPRDKLFALLGMEKIVDVMIEPKYEDSIPQVYSDFVRAFVRDKRRLSVLGGAGIGTLRPNSPIDLPSWVPDLRYLLPMVDDYTLFAAAGQTDAVVTFSADSRLLSTQGIICSTLEQLEPKPQDDDVFGRTNWVDLVLAHSPSLHPTGIPPIQAYFRTLICDSSNRACCQRDFPGFKEAQRFYDLAVGFLYILGSLLPERSKLKRRYSRIPQEKMDEIAAFNDYVIQYASWEGIVPCPLSETTILESFLGPPECRLQWPVITERQKGRSCRLLFADAMGNSCRNRSFFITKEGYMGLAPPGTMKSDLLCIIFGCELPLVIRQQGQQYSLVGPCYVYGMMHGEVMKDVQSGKYHPQAMDFV